MSDRLWPLLDTLNFYTKRPSGELTIPPGGLRFEVGHAPKRARGRPPGTGHPKRKFPKSIPLPEFDISKLKKAGLTQRDIAYLYAFLGGNPPTYVEAAKRLRVTPQAVQKRFAKRIFPLLKQGHPSFSPRAFRYAAADYARNKPDN